MKILVLKAPKETIEENDPYVESLRKANIPAEGLDVLSFEYINQNILQEKLLHLENYRGLIFTSPRGVVAAAKCLEGVNFDKSPWSALPFYVVGEGTANVLREKFAMASRGHESGSAQQLAQFICKDCANECTKPFLFPSADLKRNLLQETLAEADILVDVVTSYNTVPHPNLGVFLDEIFAQECSRPDTLAFFSPSGVNATLPYLLNMGVNIESLKMIAIGPTTEAALKGKGLRVFATAESPSPSGLVQALENSQGS